MNSELPREFVSAAPGAPDEEPLSSVAMQAKARAEGGARGARRGVRPVWRVAGGLVAVAAAVVAVAWVMTPRVDDSAFAKRAAIAALAPKGGVLHTASTMSWGGANEPKSSVQSESWIDFDANADRIDERSADATLPWVTVRQGRTVRSLGQDASTTNTAGVVVPGKWRIVQYQAPIDDVSPGGGNVQVLVDGLDTGKAKVTDRVEIDGDPYWVVEMEVREPGDKGTGDYYEHVTATLREGDYRIKNLRIHREGDHPHDGPWTQDVEVTWTTWDVVPRSSLSADFFELDQVDAAAPEGTIIDATAK